jgi:hypothetical protein
MPALGLKFDRDRGNNGLTGKLHNHHASCTKSRRRNLASSVHVLTCAKGCLLECYNLYYNRKTNDEQQTQQIQEGSRQEIHEQL